MPPRLSVAHSSTADAAAACSLIGVLGKDSGNPVSLSIYTSTNLGLAINFDFVRDQRSEAEMHRLAWLVRKLPGVVSHIEGLEEQSWGMHRGMDLAAVLPSNDSVDEWVAAISEAATRE
jgi:hypothetical protein